MENTKIKQRKCPFGKVELCVDYGNCADCTWHKVIEKYEKKIKKLQEENFNLSKTAIVGEVYKRNLIDLTDLSTETKKNTAKDILEIVGNKVSCDLVPMNQYSWFKELANKYGVEIESSTIKDRLDVGDTIYLPWVFDGKTGIASCPIISVELDEKDLYYETDFESDEIEYLEKYNNGIFKQSDFGKVWFTDQNQAKSRLNELIKEADGV